MVSFDFISPEVLNKQYKVIGSFYSVIENDEVKEYRNDLHIFDKDFDYRNKPENIKLLVIMMNPGESAPLSSDFPIPHFTNQQVVDGAHCFHYVPTKPDKTQYQVMRMMDGLNIKHSRVINISDIRNPQSGKLSDDLNSRISDLHSIFSDARSKELHCIYSSLAEDAFIFLAWGRDIIDCVPFKKLAEKCISTLPKKHPILGVAGGETLKVKHPLLRGKGGSPQIWLKEAENCFNDYFINGTTLF